MAFNVQTFKTRAGTAIIFVAIMLGGLCWNPWSFAGLFLIVHFGCWYEYIKLCKKIHPNNYRSLLLFGLIYITLPCLLMLDLRLHEVLFGSNNGNNNSAIIIPTAIIFSIWINDTMAYIVGSFIGKTPFSKISPKKTWEGTIGGAILCVVVITALGWYLKYYSALDWIWIAAICALFGTAGDLFESKLKRMANVKDSGSIMPGHGGFLDRFDSFLWATPFVYIYVACSNLI